MFLRTSLTIYVWGLFHLVKTLPPLLETDHRVQITKQWGLGKIWLGIKLFSMMSWTNFRLMLFSETTSRMDYRSCQECLFRISLTICARRFFICRKLWSLLKIEDLQKKLENQWVQPSFHWVKLETDLCRNFHEDLLMDVGVIAFEV